MNDFTAKNTINKRPYISEEAMASLKEYSFPGNVRELENILERAITLCEKNRIERGDLQLPEEKTLFLKKQRNGGLLEPLLDNVEKETIFNALEKTKGNKTKAAQLLGISFSALRYRLRKFKLE